MINTEFFTSPVGMLKISAEGDSILSVTFERTSAPENPSGATRECARQLTEYFDGKRDHFNLNLKPAGTPFQRSVWAELERIPYAATHTYQQTAAAIGRPAAVRAVGQANKRNPIAIVIPCHRVILKSGQSGGYNGNPRQKVWLLAHEASYRSSASCTGSSQGSSGLPV